MEAFPFITEREEEKMEDKGKVGEWEERMKETVVRM